MKQQLPRARTFNEVFNRSPHFSSIAPQIDKLRMLHQHLAASLDPKVFRQCQVADFKDGILTLVVSSPALGHTFRFLGTELVEKLRKTAPWQSLKTIKTLVRTPESSALLQDPSKAPKPSLGLCAQSAQLLQSIAATIQSVPLQNALLRLSQNLSKS
ncbi:MAG: DUF721 domain-containing protein [Gammaproteobacteria bacterium]|nr:DUF721 domain-containing protein [Gammaproteobacteria bacterium]MBP9729007.1 DUF721 domain-containing protein [Gammaproteobacteria bacterium]